MFLRQLDVIKMYGISPSSLHRYVKDKKLTEYRTPGGHRRYDEDEVKKLFVISESDDK